MNYTPSPIAIGVFLAFVGFVLGLSFYFARKAKSAEGYFAAGGSIPWWLNGVAFAGDYLSAASFLGICGMIAVAGFDGFLYSIGYLAGWVVALFVVAEPMKRLGKYTFADALDSKFNSKGIQLAAAISTLVVSIFYLIPQMVGAGSLVTPLLGWDQWMGVVLVGIVVVVIVATAGMTSTTYVQFLKGGLLIIFSVLLCICIFKAGLNMTVFEDSQKLKRELGFGDIAGVIVKDDVVTIPGDSGFKKAGTFKHFVRLEKEGRYSWWMLKKDGKVNTLIQIPSVTKLKKETKCKFTAYNHNPKVAKKEKEQELSTLELFNGYPKAANHFYQVSHLSKIVYKGKVLKAGAGTGSLGPFEFLKVLKDSEVTIFKKVALKAWTGRKGNDFDRNIESITVWKPTPTAGVLVMRPGLKFKVDPVHKKDKNGNVIIGADNKPVIDNNKTLWEKLNFVSLMLALFFGTSALPHVLIRYYTVPSQRDARKSTIVAITAIGFFYILTLFMGLGAMSNGVIDLTDTNMSAPLVAASAKVGGVLLFSIISAIAFATVLGTVSGLIVAASGAVAHDIMDNYMGLNLTDANKVKAGKIAALITGVIAIGLGIVFKGVNVSFLVGWAFAVAASANLPAIMMLLFWKKTTAKGITASILVGMIAAIAILAISPKMAEMYYGWWGVNFDAPFDLNNPGIISIPLSFITLVIVSLMTQKDNDKLDPEKVAAI